TVRGLMAATMPSAFAWRVRSRLVQWGMCNPSVTGSRQASSTIWARARGGNLLRAAQAGLVEQKMLPAAGLVAAAGTPDGGPVTPQAVSDGVDRLPAGDGEDDAGVLDLVEAQASAVGHRFQDRSVRT